MLDIALSGMDGYELAQVLHAQPENDGKRLFASSGYGQSDDVKRARTAGFERHFVKPIALPGLVDLLHETRLGEGPRTL
ncbi:hypothetical protein A9R05_39105 (plasmid) [Burkholderia sp. KK1]|nr:hypothetical protein A9R05_39105 [Burkholderia sp. KK1]